MNPTLGGLRVSQFAGRFRPDHKKTPPSQHKEIAFAWYIPLVNDVCICMHHGKRMQEEAERTSGAQAEPPGLGEVRERIAFR